MKNNILITICARGGSKGIKGKNIKDLVGKPLIYYTIKQAIEWGKGKHTIVTTDSDEIAKIARDCGAEVPFMRPAELATDSAPTLPVLQHALRTCEKIFKETFDILMDLPVTAPIRKIIDLDNALNLFLEKMPKNLVTVVPANRNPYFNMLEETNDGKVNYSKPNKSFTRRQDAPKVYDMNNSIYIYQSKYLKDKSGPKDKISDHTIAYIMDEMSAIDIDKEIDFKILEILIRESIVQL